MKKVLIFIMAVSLLSACKNDKNSKDNRNGSKEKDDYRTGDDKMNDSKDTKNTDFTNDDKKNNTDNVSSNDDSGAGWSKSDESRFMNDCEGTAKENVGAARANEYCDCMLQRMKKKYSSYAETNRELEGATKEEINELAAPCNGK